MDQARHARNVAGERFDGCRRRHMRAHLLDLEGRDFDRLLLVLVAGGALTRAAGVGEGYGHRSGGVGVGLLYKNIR